MLINQRFKRPYAIIFAIVAWFALLLQLQVTINTSLGKGLTLWTAIARYFSYFTIENNILVALVFTAVALRSSSTAAKFFTKPRVQTAIAAYITIVGLVYHLLLRNIWNPQGWQLLADNVLHYVTPLFYILFWLAFVQKSTIHWKSLPSWLIYPVIYSVFTLVRGAITGWYPYPFINAAELGYARVLINTLFVFLGFAIISSIFMAIARFLSRRLQSQRRFAD
ncbi:MAG: Pr6Pr family membrane protein [Cyanobacteria bacterium J069]